MNERATLKPHKFEKGGPAMNELLDEIKALTAPLEEARARMEEVKAAKFSGYQVQLVAEQEYDHELEKLAKALAPNVLELIAEVERLRKIEDAARSLDHCVWEFGEDAPSACGEHSQIMSDALDANPRPETANLNAPSARQRGGEMG